MEKKTNMQHKKIHHLQNSMIMYGIYNSDTLEQLNETVHRIHNTSSWHEHLQESLITGLSGTYIKME